MSKTKFSEVMDLIAAIFDFIAELIPLGRDGISLVKRITQVVKDFKEELKDDADNVSALQD